MSLLWGGLRTDVDPATADALDALFATVSGQWAVAQAWRSTLYQTTLWDRYQAQIAAGVPLAQQDKAAPPGESPHEHVSPAGAPASLAIDVARIIVGSDSKSHWLWDYYQPDGKTPTPAWAALWAAIAAAPTLHSGIHFNDPDHIEDTRWAATLAEILAAKRAEQVQA